MKLYKIQSEDGCGLYRYFHEYPKLSEIVDMPGKCTVTECYLGKSGQVHASREISLKTYSSIVTQVRRTIASTAHLENRGTRIVYPESGHRSIHFEKHKILEAAADFMTRPAFVDDGKINTPELVAATRQRFGVTYFQGPSIITEKKDYKSLTIGDVKKMEIGDDNDRVLMLIFILDTRKPEWRQPHYNTMRLESLIRVNPCIKNYVDFSEFSDFLVPKYIKFPSNGTEVDIGEDLLIQ
jgi:hypothetical protein